MISPIEAKNIANRLGLTDARVLCADNSDPSKYTLFPLFCGRNNQTCELSLRVPGGIGINPQEPEKPILEVNNGCRITTCAECPRPRLTR